MAFFHEKNSICICLHVKLIIHWILFVNFAHTTPSLRSCTVYNVNFGSQSYYLMIVHCIGRSTFIYYKRNNKAVDYLFFWKHPLFIIRMFICRDYWLWVLYLHFHMAREEKDPIDSARLLNTQILQWESVENETFRQKLI